MNILIQLSHPAHFHLYKKVAQSLIDNGNKVLFVIKSKDILEPLLQNAGLPYVNINQYAHRGSKFGVVWDMLIRDWRIIKLCRKHKIDLITGSTPETAHVSWLLRIHGVNTGEDDLAVVPMFRYVAGPFMQCGLSPDSCDEGALERVGVHYPGYHELAYLHPNHFTPDSEIVRSYGIPVPQSPSKLGLFHSASDSQLVPQIPNSSFNSEEKEQAEPYFILRFASLNAHHDSGIKGINTEVAQRLIDILSPHGRIYITSERPLEPQFEQYRIKINPLDMHHVMAFASLYIGDSQTMAAEAGVLGVPFVRFNDFVGRIGYLRELEDKYELGYGIHASVLADDSPIRRADGSAQPSGVEALYERVEQLVAMPAEERKEIFQSRREKMLAEKIDCAKFLTWFIENYPASAGETKKADEAFWERFK